jgi:chromosome segregation ATPase
MINTIYIDEAQRIRLNYLEALNGINKTQSKLNYHRNKLSEILNNMQNIVDDFKDNNLNSDETKDKLNYELNFIEDNIEKIQNELIPFNNIIEQLKKDSKTLYDTISEKYPDYNQEQIQNIIFSELIKRGIK